MRMSASGRKQTVTNDRFRPEADGRTRVLVMPLSTVKSTESYMPVRVLPTELYLYERS